MQTAESINQLYRDAWSKFATGVTVITTVEPSGSVHGMTASSVTSVSLDPPLMLIVIGEERQSHELIETTGRFGMSILEVGQADIAKHFAIPPESRGSLDDGLSRQLFRPTALTFVPWHPFPDHLHKARCQSQLPGAATILVANTFSEPIGFILFS